MPTSSPTFWTRQDQYGRYRETDGAAVLVVFVHGVLASARTWGQLPEKLAQTIGCDADIFAFEYPAFPWLRCGGIKEVAADLRNALKIWRRKRERSWESIVFITHSTGGLVVKQLLKEDFTATIASAGKPAPDGSPLRYDELPDGVRSTRNVLHVCVPHGGASVAANVVIYAYVALSVVAYIPLSLIRLASIGKLNWGFNRLSWELRRNNPELLTLDQELLNLKGQVDQLDLPTPTFVDFRGRADVAVSGDDRVVEDLRGGHLTLKNTEHLRGAVEPYFQRYQFPIDVSVADRTIARVFNLDSVVRISRLVHQDREHRSQSLSRQGTQGHVADLMLGVLTAGAKDCRRLVVTGPAGVGKSSVLRNLARRISVTFFNNWEENARLLLGFPLQQVSFKPEEIKKLLDSPDVGKELFGALTRYWSQWVGNLIDGRGIDPQWLHSRLRERPTILMFDGIDEFVTNNPGLGLRQMRAMFEYIQELDADSPERDIDLLLGVRSSYPDHRSLASSGNLVFEILPLTTAQAIALYPAMEPVLTEIGETPTADLLRTPLVLQWLGPRADRLVQVAKELRSRGFIIHQALLAMIEESKLPSRTSRNAEISHEEWHEALITLGWIYFQGFLGDVDAETLDTRLKDLRDTWQPYPRQGPTTAFAGALDLLQDPEVRNAILTRTVFLPTGDRSWRFAHREWQDYLAACYLARCVQARNVDEMRHLAFTQAMFQVAGELLENATIDEDFVGNILAKGGLITVNFAGLVGNSYFQMTPQALRLLLSQESLAKMSTTAKLVTFTAVGYRALKSAALDRSRDDLQREAISAFKTYSQKKDGPRDAVTDSLAWCNYKALASKFKAPAPADPWPALGLRSDHEQDALRVISSGPETGMKVHPAHQSLQVAMAQIQEVALRERDRPVSTMHYLYYVCVARKYKVHVPEIIHELDSVFGLESKVAGAIRGYEDVPELWQIFQNCRATYETRES